jgi:Protein of unknown function (DUF2798)
LTFFNIGWRNDFVMRWWSAFAIGWPVAASTAYLAIPFARSLTQRIVVAVERTCVFARRRTDAWLMVDCVRLSRSAARWKPPH